jgi:hypothetical protein
MPTGDDADDVTWLQEQAELLWLKRLTDMDTDRLVEELSVRVEEASQHLRSGLAQLLTEMKCTIADLPRTCPWAARAILADGWSAVVALAVTRDDRDFDAWARQQAAL